MNDNSYKVIEVDINEILPNRFQPRIQFDEEEILELSDSIKEHGVIQPLVVRTIGDKYEIIAGERRYKASVLAGKETVPVIIKNLNDKDSAEIALIENIQRKNLTPIEEALSYKKILDMGYLTQENLATKLGKSQSSVANKIRLLNLSDEVQEALLDNKISERHARSLLRLKSINDQNKMLSKITQERLTVRKTDEEIDKILNSSSIDNEESDGSEKIIEKGDINMNNEMNQIPNVVTPQGGTTFDIFGGAQPAPAPVAPQAIPTLEVPSAPAVPTMEPITPSMEPVVPVMPAVEQTPAPVAPQAMPTLEVPSVPAVPTMEPITPSMEPVAPVMPAVEPMPSAPQMDGIQFDANGNVIAAPTSMPTLEVPSTPSVPTMEPITPSMEPIAPVMPAVEPVVDLPVTSPIMESNSLNINSLPQTPNIELQEISSVPTPSTPTTINEFSTPEPIIVTDYNKQYDPVMPNAVPAAPSKVDFKEIINAIRECSDKIEKYGYRIDVEEYDLSTLYQVVFKIEK